MANNAAFLAVWFFLALPLAIEVAVEKFFEVKSKYSRAPYSPRELEQAWGVDCLSVTVSDNVQGGQAAWLVQVIWALYNSARTLLFSILLVTVSKIVFFLTAWIITTPSKVLGGYWRIGVKGDGQE